MARTRRTQDPPANDETPPDDTGYVDPVDPIELGTDDLDFLSDTSEPDTTWYVERFKTPEEQRSSTRGKAMVFVAKVPAPIDLAAFHNDYGGGLYRFAKRRADGHFHGTRMIELDGQPRIRIFDNPKVETGPLPPAQPAAAMNALPVMDPTARLLRGILRELRELKESRPVNTPAAPDPIALVTAIFGISERISARRETPNDALNPLIDAFTRGIDLGTARDPAAASNGTDWVQVVKELAPVARDILQGVAARTRAARAATPGQPGQPAPAATATATSMGVPSAAATEPAPAEPAATPRAGEDPDALRWNAAVMAVARGIGRNTDPRDLASSLADMLEDGDLAKLRMATADQVADEIAQWAPVYPVLGTPPGRAYITSVHAELVNPSPDDDEPETD